MEQSEEVLQEVVLTAGVNPAHRIIKRAYRNKERHNPLEFNSFEYNSYNKFHVTFPQDSVDRPDTLLTRQDSSDEALYEFFETKHIFMMESVTKRKYLKPSNDEEEVLASRVSGLKNPMFNMLATQFQSFSFHEEYIQVLGESYLNPISNGSTNRYVFEIKDTNYREQDTVYIISFSPSNSARFTGLTGVLYINTDGYAIQNVIAEPAVATGFDVKIQQQYRKVGDFWFPEQLNTDLLLGMVQMNDVAPLGIGRSYIRNVKIGGDLKRRSFGATEVVLNPAAGERDDAFWEQYRVETLNDKEKETYFFIDSLSKAENLETKMAFISALLSGEVPLGKVSLDLNRILGYNQYEQLKLGLGLKTNPKFSTNFGLSGFANYAFGDDRVKYGGSVWGLLYRPNQTKLFAKYRQEIVESGGIQSAFYEYSLLTPDFRYFNLDNHVDLIDQREIGLRSYINANLEAYFSYDEQRRIPQYDLLAIEGNSTIYTLKSFRTALKFRPNDTKMLTNFGMLNIAKSLPSIVVDYSFAPRQMNQQQVSRLLVIADFEKNWTRLGTSYLKVLGGYASKDAPLPFLISGYGSATRGGLLNNLASDGSFETMRFGEFVAPTLASAYLVQDLGAIFGKLSFSDYSVRLHGGAMIGDHLGEKFRPGVSDQIGKPFYEAGVSVANIFGGLGIGAYSRLGYHASPKFEDNINLKLTIAVAF